MRPPPAAALWLLLPVLAAAEEPPVRVRVEPGGRAASVVFECATAGTAWKDVEDLTLVWTINGPTADRPAQRPWAAPEFLWPPGSRRLASGKVASPMERLGPQTYRVAVRTDATVWRINYAVDSAARFGTASHRMNALLLGSVPASTAEGGARESPKASVSAAQSAAPARSGPAPAGGAGTAAGAAAQDDIWSLVLIDHAGRPFKLADLKARALLLMFQFEGCGACKSALPKIEQLYSEVRRLGANVAAVDPIDDPPKESAYVKSPPVSFPFLFDPRRQTARFTPARGYPTFYLLDEKGSVRRTWIGLPPAALDEMRREIHDLAF